MSKRTAVGIVVIALIIIAFVAITNDFQVFQDSQKTKIVLVPSAENPYGTAKISVAALDNKGKGVTSEFSVEAMPGNGRILANINNILFFIDTQFSIQTAKNVAANFTGIDVSKVDLIYDLKSDAQIVEGPSAGAALTIATIAALENKSLNPNILITGTIEPDGTIGKVGGILEKTRASGEAGAKIFLVPAGQGLTTTYEKVKSCEEIDSITFCKTEYVRHNTTSSLLGIFVIEVSNVQEALKYFLN